MPVAPQKPTKHEAFGANSEFAGMMAYNGASPTAMSDHTTFVFGVPIFPNTLAGGRQKSFATLYYYNVI